MFLSGFILLSGCSKEPLSPNIILIFADDLGYETLGTYGGESYHTPNLDKLADGGMRFDHCYSTPLCTPSRVQIMTGKYSFRNYIGFGLLDPSETTFAHYLKQLGYVTAVTGKWQLYGNDYQRELAGNKAGSWPEDAGFDHYLLWQVHERGSRYKDPTLTRTGKLTNTHMGKYGPDLFLEFIENFIRQNRDSSFFLYYPMVLTHDPFVPVPGRPGWEDSTEHKQNQVKYFSPMVHYMDSLVGRIASVLESEGIRENTLLLFIGDNGTDRDIISDFKGVKIKGNKGFTTDAGIHVPMIASWPGVIRPKSVNHNLIDFTDFLPTMLEVAGGDPIGFSGDGRSFYRQLSDPDHAGREWVFTHYEPVWGNFKRSRYIHNHDWKLYEDGRIFHIGRDREEVDTLKPEELDSEDRKIIEGFYDVLNSLK